MTPVSRVRREGSRRKPMGQLKDYSMLVESLR